MRRDRELLRPAQKQTLVELVPGPLVAQTRCRRSSIGSHIPSRQGYWLRYIVAGGFFALLSIAPAQAQRPVLVSVNNTGTGSAYSGAYNQSVSANGRFVAFESASPDLVPGLGNFNFTNNIYVRDLVTGTTQLVSANRNGTDGGNNYSFAPIISGDGKSVAFQSFATDLVAGVSDTSFSIDIFVRNLETGTTQLVSINKNGTAAGNGESSSPTISADGKSVAFRSFATNLVAGVSDTNFSLDIFVRNLETGTTQLVSINRNGTAAGNNYSVESVISADGKSVAFQSNATNLVAGATDNNDVTDVFVRDLAAGTTQLVSINRNGTAAGNNYSAAPVISADGKSVAFQSGATNLVAGVGDSNSTSDIFVRDLEAGTTQLVSINRNGTAAGNNYSAAPVISADGKSVAFDSYSTDLVAGATDNNGATDVFVRDLSTGTTQLVSINSAGTATSDGNSFVSSISADGTVVAFVSAAGDLTGVNDSGRAEGGNDVFVRDLATANTVLLSINREGTDTGNLDSYRPIVSANGRRVVFTSQASDLVPNDFNRFTDVFAALLPLSGDLQFSSAFYTEQEGSSTAIITVVRSRSSTGPVTVDYATNRGTATPDVDYEDTSGTLTFRAGQMSATFSVPILDDTRDEAGETIHLALSNPATGTTLGRKTATLTIIDNDPLPRLSISNVRVTEGTGGAPTNATFTVRLSPVSGRIVKVNYSTFNGSATTPSDYNANSNTLTFLPGQTVKTITVAINADASAETDETFSVKLSAPSNATIVDGIGVGAIIDDDSPSTGTSVHL